MIRYVLTSAAVADKLTAALWGLAVPPGAERTTKGMFGYLTDLSNQKWLAVPDDFSIPVHAEAELDGIADVLQPWIDANQIPADTNEVLTALIESKRGQRLIIWDAFPDFFRFAAKTHEELIAMGLLPPLITYTTPPIHTPPPSADS